MDAAAAVDLCRTTLMAAVIIAAPMLIIGMARRPGGRADAGADANPGSNGCVCAEDSCHGGGSGCCACHGW